MTCRSTKMPEIVPTAEEMLHASLTLSDILQALAIPHAFISSTALHMLTHSSHLPLSLPFTPSPYITVLLLPTTSPSALNNDLPSSLLASPYSHHFTTKYTLPSSSSSPSFETFHILIPKLTTYDFVSRWRGESPKIPIQILYYTLYSYDFVWRRDFERGIKRGEIKTMKIKIHPKSLEEFEYEHPLKLKQMVGIYQSLISTKPIVRIREGRQDPVVITFETKYLVNMLLGSLANHLEKNPVFPKREWVDSYLEDVHTFLVYLYLLDQRIGFRTKKEIRGLKALVGVWDEGMDALRARFDCPEVLGPWWKVGWVRLLGACVGVWVAWMGEDWVEGVWGWDGRELRRWVLGVGIFWVGYGVLVRGWARSLFRAFLGGGV